MSVCFIHSFEKWQLTVFWSQYWVSFAYGKGIIWLVVSLCIGCVHVWESRGWGVLTVALGGSIWRGGRQGLLWHPHNTHGGSKASEGMMQVDTTLIVPRTLSYVCRNTHTHTVTIYTCTLLNGTITMGVLQYSRKTSILIFPPPNLVLACSDDSLPTHDVVSNDNRYCVFQSER